jgi:uncharacterized membrane protein (UPF0127 family)
MKKMMKKKMMKKIKAKICSSFFSKSKGLMFSRKIGNDESLLFVFDKESIFGRSIHMLFVFYPINIFWLDKNYIVIDKTLAKPFGLYYAPNKPCKYILETNSEFKADIGEKIHLHNINDSISKVKK